MEVLTLNKNNFEEKVIKEPKAVLVDFWAVWCGPCKMMSPVIDKVKEEMGDEIVVGKVNVDEEPDLAVQYDVMSIPTFLVFKNGKIVNRTVGVQDKEDIKKMLE